LFFKNNLKNNLKMAFFKLNIRRMSTIQHVKIIPDPLYQRFRKHPFKAYTWMAGTTFCLVAGTNAISLFTDVEKMEWAALHPEGTAMALFTKSTYFGFLWPAWYFIAVTSPRNAFVLWSSYDNVKNQ
jgi:hypothetical protein